MELLSAESSMPSRWLALRLLRRQLVRQRVEKDAPVSALVTDEIERGDAVVIARDRFAVDDAGARAQVRQRLDDQREAMGEVIARTAVEPHLRAVLAGDDAEAVVLDLVQPLAARRQCVGFDREARRDEPGRESAHTQHNAP